MSLKASPLVPVFCAAQALGDGVPEWIHLLPRTAPGQQLETVDGRGPYFWDGSVPALMGINGEARVLVDENHATAIKAGKGEATPAHGWMVELQARADGLWGRVEWNPSGRALLDNKSYRHVSPELRVEKASRRIFGISGASLLNTPNLKHLIPVLNSQETSDMAFLTLLCAALGLAETTTEEAALAAAAKLKGDGALALALQGEVKALGKAAGLKDDASHEVVLSQVQALADPARMVPAAQFLALQAQLGELAGAQKKDKATAFVKDAIKRGVVGVSEANQGFWISRHMAEPVETEAVLGTMPVMTGKMAMPAKPGGAGAAELNELDSRVAQLMTIDPVAFAKTKAAHAALEEVL